MVSGGKRGDMRHTSGAVTLKEKDQAQGICTIDNPKALLLSEGTVRSHNSEFALQPSEKQSQGRTNEAFKEEKFSM